MQFLHRFTHIGTYLNLRKCFVFKKRWVFKRQWDPKLWIHHSKVDSTPLRVQLHRDFGVLFENKLTFVKYTETIIASARGALMFIKYTLKNKFSFTFCKRLANNFRKNRLRYLKSHLYMRRKDGWCHLSFLCGVQEWFWIHIKLFVVLANIFSFMHLLSFYSSLWAFQCLDCLKPLQTPTHQIQWIDNSKKRENIVFWTTTLLLMHIFETGYNLFLEIYQCRFTICCWFEDHAMDKLMPFFPQHIVNVRIFFLNSLLFTFLDYSSMLFRINSPYTMD